MLNLRILQALGARGAFAGDYIESLVQLREL